jgi:hypothetical protein
MATEPQILYLEPDDEITSVVRRLRETDAERVVLVAPARTKATSSAVALRLLAALADEQGMSLGLVADPLARSLAAEAGLPAYASVADARTGVSPAVPAPASRAPIHVVRPDDSAEREAEPEPEREPAPESKASRAPIVPVVGPGDETRAIPTIRQRPVARPAPSPRRGVPRAQPTRRAARPAGAGTARLRQASVVGIAVLVIALVLVGAAGAAVLPAASVRITPVTRPVGPASYTLTAAGVEHDAGKLTETESAKASGDHVERTAASGSVVFENWNYRRVRVPKGTRVAAGEILFATTEEVNVPSGKLTGRGTIAAGEATARVVAVEPGPAGNVEAGAIDTVADREVAAELRGFPSNLPLVRNPQPTQGGAEDHAPQITQADVDGLRARVGDALRQQLASHLAEAAASWVVGPAGASEDPVISVPKDLVGSVGKESFELTGTLSYDRLRAPRDSLVAAAGERLLADPAQRPAGAAIDPERIQVTLGEVRVSGDQLQVAAEVRATAVPAIDEEQVRSRIAGMSAEEAQAALDDLGVVEVRLWPGWVDHVPTLAWRISVETQAPLPAASPGASR